jgi:hypothetical protein
MPCMAVALITIKQDSELVSRCAFTVSAPLLELHPAWLCRVLALLKRLPHVESDMPNRSHTRSDPRQTQRPAACAAILW